MQKNHVVSQDSTKKAQNRSRFMGALILGAFAGVFVGLLAMALAILIFGILRLFLPDSTFQLAGMSATAVIFVIFCALGWVAGAMLAWYKLPASPSDS